MRNLIRTMEADNYYRMLSFRATIISILSLLLFYIFTYHSRTIYQIRKQIMKLIYTNEIKAIMIAYDRELYQPCLIMLIIVILSFYSKALNICTLLGWVLPSDNVLRSYFLPSIRFPVSLGPLMQSNTGATSTSLDIGPMITVAMINYVISKLNKMAYSSFVTDYRFE